MVYLNKIIYVRFPNVISINMKDNVFAACFTYAKVSCFA